jgi:hypothetical protein
MRASEFPIARHFYPTCHSIFCNYTWMV